MAYSPGEQSTGMPYGGGSTGGTTGGTGIPFDPTDPYDLFFLTHGYRRPPRSTASPTPPPNTAPTTPPPVTTPPVVPPSVPRPPGFGQIGGRAQPFMWRWGGSSMFRPQLGQAQTPQVPSPASQPLSPYRSMQPGFFGGAPRGTLNMNPFQRADNGAYSYGQPQTGGQLIMNAPNLTGGKSPVDDMRRPVLQQNLTGGKSPIPGR